jgi:hypothetical protein
MHRQLPLQRPPAPSRPSSTSAALSQPSRYQTPGENWDTDNSNLSASSSNSSESDSDSDSDSDSESESNSSSFEENSRTQRQRNKGKKRKRRTTKHKGKRKKKSRRGPRLSAEDKKVVLQIAVQGFEVYAYTKTKAKF